MIARISRILISTLLVLLSCGSSRGEPVHLRYGAGYSTIRSIYSLPILIARDRGFFTRHGLAVDIVVPYPGGSERMVTALYNDTVDITHVATPFLIRKVLAGSDAVAIAAEFANPIYSLVAKPEIKSFAALRNRVIGLADEAGSISISMRRLLRKHGLGPGDFRVKVIAGTPARLDCLQRGECDAVPLGQPQDLAAAAAGFRVLGLSTEAVPDYLYTVSAVSRAWANSHQDAVVRYVRALAATFGFIRDSANREVVVDSIVAATGVTPAIARQTLSLYLNPDGGVLPKRGEINLTGLAQVIAMMGEAGELRPPFPKPERFVDLRYLHAAGVP